MHTTFNLTDLPDEKEITLTKKEYMENITDQTAYTLMSFIDQCEDMAEANWCGEHVTMLKRLFRAVLNDREYSDPIK